MNLWSVTALGIGAMVGAGIFALLGQAALVAGGETYIAFIVGGVIALLSGYSYAKLATRYPDAGAITAYFDHAFGAGQLAGTLSLIYLITLAATVAMIAKAFGAYATPLVGGGSSRMWIDGFASGIVILLALLNIAGSGLVGKAEIVLVGIKLVILTVLMVAGAVGMIGKPPAEHLHPSVMALISSVGLTFFAYAGYGMMANAAGSVPHPERTIPRAIFLAVSVVIVLYVGLAAIVLGSLSSSELAQHANTAVAEAAEPVLGHAGYIIVSVGALLATASAVNAYVFAAMKIAVALAQAGQLPRMFDQRVWREGTRGLLLGIGGVLLAINIFNLDALAHIASATFLIVYLAVHVAHWRLIDKTEGYRLPVAIGFLSMAAVLACFLWTTAIAQPWSVGLIVVFIAGSWAIEVLLARLNVASGSQSNVKAASAKADAAGPEATKSAAAEPDAKSGPQPDAKADGVKEKSGNPTRAKGEKAAELQPDVNSQPEAESNAGFTELMHATLGNVLLAGLAKDPHSIERIVAETVTKAEARAEAALAQAHATKAEPEPVAKSEAESEARAEPSRQPKPSQAAKPVPTRRPKTT